MEYICVFLIISIFVLTIMSFTLGALGAVDYIVELLGYGSINNNISHIMGGILNIIPVCVVLIFIVVGIDLLITVIKAFVEVIQEDKEKKK